VTRVRLLVVSAILFASCSRHSEFLPRHVTLSDHIYRYRVWVPSHYTKLRKWPVVLYLHGSGERGDDNLRPLANGLPPLLQKYQGRYRCIVVIPQCRYGHEWYGDMELQVLAALEQTIKEFNGDRDRIYLTGVSMGGAGAWYMARHRNKFAAVVPVCGEVTRQPHDPFPSELPPDLAAILHSIAPFASLAKAIGTTPAWAFHGAKDSVIPVTQSRDMVAALRATGGNVHYTEYAAGEHDIWDAAYSDSAMVRWMFKQKKR
jgi:predicted peptidase